MKLSYFIIYLGLLSANVAFSEVDPVDEINLEWIMGNIDGQECVNRFNKIEDQYQGQNKFEAYRETCQKDVILSKKSGM